MLILTCHFICVLVALPGTAGELWTGRAGACVFSTKCTPVCLCAAASLILASSAWLGVGLRFGSKLGLELGLELGLGLWLGVGLGLRLGLG